MGEKIKKGTKHTLLLTNENFLCFHDQKMHSSLKSPYPPHKGLGIDPRGGGERGS